MSSVKQSKPVFGNAPTNLAHAKEQPIYLTLKEVAELLKVKPRTQFTSVGEVGSVTSRSTAGECSEY